MTKYKCLTWVFASHLCTICLLAFILSFLDWSQPIMQVNTLLCQLLPHHSFHPSPHEPGLGIKFYLHPYGHVQRIFAYYYYGYFNYITTKHCSSVRGNFFPSSNSSNTLENHVQTSDIDIIVDVARLTISTFVF